MRSRIYDEGWSDADQARYFAHLDRQRETHRVNKRGWGLFIALFAGFFLVLWMESWNPVAWVTFALILGYLCICAVVFFILIRSAGAK